MEKEEWHRRYKDRIIEQAAMTEDEAQEVLDALDTIDYDDDPVDCADTESEWIREKLRSDLSATSERCAELEAEVADLQGLVIEYNNELVNARSYLKEIHDKVKRSFEIMDLIAQVSRATPESVKLRDAIKEKMEDGGK